MVRLNKVNKNSKFNIFFFIYLDSDERSPVKDIVSTPKSNSNKKGYVNNETSSESSSVSSSESSTDESSDDESFFKSDESESDFHSESEAEEIEIDDNSKEDEAEVMMDFGDSSAKEDEEMSCFQKGTETEEEDSCAQSQDSEKKISTTIGSFVIVSIETKREFFYYVGVVIGILENVFKISFLKKTLAGKFSFPAIEDCSEVSLNEIQCILSNPDVDRRENYTFQSDEIKKYKLR